MLDSQKLTAIVNRNLLIFSVSISFEVLAAFLFEFGNNWNLPWKNTGWITVMLKSGE